MAARRSSGVFAGSGCAEPDPSVLAVRVDSGVGAGVEPVAGGIELPVVGAGAGAGVDGEPVGVPGPVEGVLGEGALGIPPDAHPPRETIAAAAITTEDAVRRIWRYPLFGSALAAGDALSDPLKNVRS